jgi:hypothetical protein
MQFKTMRELMRVVQVMERVTMNEQKKEAEQGHVMGVKMVDYVFFIGKPPLLNKRKSGQSSSQF